LAWHLQKMAIDYSNGPDLSAVVVAQRERVTTLVEMAEQSRFLFEEQPEYDQEAINKVFSVETPAILTPLSGDLTSLDDWSKEALHKTIVTTAERLGLKMGQVAQPLRVAVTGSTRSPSIDTTLELLGKDKTLQRLNQVQVQLQRNY